MTRIRGARADDVGFLAEHERIGAEVLGEVLDRGRILVADDGPALVGWLRWGLFWDEVPFMNLLHVVEGRRGHGIGTLLVREWEAQCRAAGHPMVLTSTQADESAQHFYRRLGYSDTGALLLPGEAAELILIRSWETDH